MNVTSVIFIASFSVASVAAASARFSLPDYNGTFLAPTPLETSRMHTEATPLRADPCPPWPSAIQPGHDLLLLTIYYDQVKKKVAIRSGNSTISHPDPVNAQADIDLGKAKFTQPVDTYFAIDPATLAGATFLQDPYDSIWIEWWPDGNTLGTPRRTYPKSFSEACGADSGRNLRFTMSNMKKLVYRYNLIIEISGHEVVVEPKIVNQ